MKKAGVVILTAAMTISAACAGYLGTFVSDISSYAAYESKHTLSNPDADEITSRVYDYICDSFGNTILAGQQESTWMDSVDYEPPFTPVCQQIVTIPPFSHQSLERLTTPSKSPPIKSRPLTAGSLPVFF